MLKVDNEYCKREKVGRNECMPTPVGYILKALLGLCFNSILFLFISDVIVSLKKSYIFQISLAILTYCCYTSILTRFCIETEKTAI